MDRDLSVDDLKHTFSILVGRPHMGHPTELSQAHKGAGTAYCFALPGTSYLPPGTLVVTNLGYSIRASVVVVLRKKENKSSSRRTQVILLRCTYVCATK